MSWNVTSHTEFLSELKLYDNETKIELFAKLKLLSEFGPTLSRPHADTLDGSKHSNMKELRFTTTDGVWRIAFAFDPNRQAILLVGGDKSGTSQKRFYKNLIKKNRK